MEHPSLWPFSQPVGTRAAPSRPPTEIARLRRPAGDDRAAGVRRTRKESRPRLGRGRRSLPQARGAGGGARGPVEPQHGTAPGPAARHLASRGSAYGAGGYGGANGLRSIWRSGALRDVAEGSGKGGQV